jgi:hypothetical protein
MSAREKDLGALRFANDLVEIGAHPIARIERFTRHSVIPANNTLGTPKIDDHMTVLNALDHARYDFPNPILEVSVLALTFRIANLLSDNLLGGLSGNSPEFKRRKFVPKFIADLGLRRDGPGVFKAELGHRIINRLNDCLNAPEARFARIRINLGANVVLEAVARAGSLLNGFLHRIKHDALIDRFLLSDRIRDLENLKPVR